MEIKGKPYYFYFGEKGKAYTGGYKKIKKDAESEKDIIANEVNDEERQSNSKIAIKELLQEKNYIVVLDANILLKIYRSSPDYAEFALECLGSIKDYKRKESYQLEIR